MGDPSAHVAGPRVRLIVPRRADNGHRDALWSFCRRYWAEAIPDWPIVEGIHEGPQAFNRGRAVNAGAGGDWDVAVVLDSDVIVDAGLVREAVERAATTGHMVLPFTARQLLGAQGTREIVEGYVGSWDRFVIEKVGPKHVSSCFAVPRALWDEVGGFDERFDSWGGDDDAFHAACKALSGVDRLTGVAWHLWHPHSPWRDANSASYRQVRALATRYIGASDAETMRRLLDEPRTADQIAVVVLTNGTRDTLAKTLHSLDEMVTGPIGRRVIVGDRCSPEHEGWDVVWVKGGGYTRAVAAANEVAIGCGQPWVFFTEDDFTFNEPVDLAAMQSLMDANPNMVQLSLKRQAWYSEEIAAGGIVEAKPDAFRQRDGWVEHRDYWTQNPMLCRRSFLASHRWPRCAGSERRFGQDLFASDLTLVVGILGEIADPPRVTHIGTERAGRGY